MLMTKMFAVGMLSANCYVLTCRDTLQAAVVDPGFDSQTDAEEVIAYLTKNGLDLKFIINTHGHDDHIKGDDLFKKRYHVPICIHSLDAEYIENTSITREPDNVLLEEGDQLTFGSETLKVLHTPGHTRGSICLIGEKVVFSGDTLFAGSIGRTDFAGGSMQDMRASLEKLKQLPDYLIMYAGHGETSLIGQEKKVNPFLTGEYSLF